jgi:23S rRNA pseudouridine2605 synthase
VEKSRVQKFIALSGLCSRRKAEILIEEKRVKVNNKIIGLGDQCLPTDVIKVDNKIISFDLDNKIYILLNKPKGYVTTRADEFNRDTVFDLINVRDMKSNLFSVGRLDKDTSGLLILTNDGDLTQKIIHPSNRIAKEYVVDLNKILDDKNKERIEAGLKLDDDVQLNPCRIQRLGKKSYIVTIWEGRKRQIRRMFEQRYMKVMKLHRTKIGSLELERLKLGLGEYKFVTKEFLENSVFEK